MTGFIGTIDMDITGLSALMTMSDDILRDPLSQPIVEHKILSNEFALETLLFYLSCVVDDSAFQMVNMIKAFMQQVSARFFTTNTTGAIHDNIFVLFVLHHVNSHRQLVAESVAWNFNRIFEMTHFQLVVISHIDHHSFGIFHQFIHLLRIHIMSFLFHAE